VPGFPRELQIVPTNACNLRCRNCPKTYYKTDDRHLHPDIYERVKKELFPYVRVLNLQGLGEPLMSPLLPQMIEDARVYDLKIQFVTNAVLFKSGMIKKLVETGASVTVSLDGAMPKTHEEARPGARFETIMNVLQEFRDEREKTATDFSLNINTVVTSKNIEELEGILEIASRYRAEVVNLINPGVGERDDEFARAAISRHPELLGQKIAQLVDKAEQLGIDLVYPGFVTPKKNETLQARNNDHTTGHKEEPAGRLFPGKCYDPWRLVYIDVDGWVRPCCRALWIGMGNIMEQSFRSIWNNEHYVKLRASVNSNNPPEFCRTCTVQWGITQGDEFYVEKLEGRGIVLPEPPEIGVTYSPGEMKLS